MVEYLHRHGVTEVNTDRGGGIRMQRTYRAVAFVALLGIIALVFTAASPGPAGKTIQNDGGEGGKYGKYFIYDAPPYQIPPEIAAKMKKAQKKEASTVEGTRLVSLDGMRLEGAPYMDFVWLWKGSAKSYAESEHVHNFDEFIGFIGTRGLEDPHGLGGEMEVWLGGEKYIIAKSCLIFVPKGVKHCPIRFNRIDSPVLFFTGSFQTKETEYGRTATKFRDDKAAERNYAKYISYNVNPQKAPAKDDSEEGRRKLAEMRQKSGSTVESARILDLDLVEGAPYIDFAWLYKGYEKNTTHPEHAHEWGEIFGFIGSAGQGDPHNLGGEVEFWVDGEKHVLTKSCLVWIPPNLPHCPVRFARIDKPILWFTIGIGMKGSAYTFSKPPANTSR
jgi:quercetin dioxygenase-like cupin family protein